MAKDNAVLVELRATAQDRGIKLLKGRAVTSWNILNTSCYLFQLFLFSFYMYLYSYMVNILAVGSKYFRMLNHALDNLMAVM